MKHLEASHLLSERDTGHLSPDRIQALDAHIADCQECRAWVATYRLLADSLAEPSSSKHLNSQDLCDFALEAPGLNLAAQGRCQRHLEGCPVCSREIGLVRSAVRHPLEEAVVIADFARRLWKHRAAPATLALAAGLVLVIGGLVLVGRLAAPVPEAYRLIGHTVLADQTIEASQSILVAATKVESGSTLNLESEVVAFGNGFSVDTGAALVVITNRSSEEDDSSQS